MDYTDRYKAWLYSDYDSAVWYLRELRDLVDESDLDVEDTFDALCTKMEQDWEDWWGKAHDGLPEPVWFVVEVPEPDFTSIGEMLFDLWGIEGEF